MVIDPNDTCAPPPEPGNCQDPVPIYYASGMGLTDFAWSPDGTQFAVAQDTGDREDPQYQIVIVDRELGLVTGTWFHDHVMPDTVDPDRFKEIDWAPDTPTGGSRLLAFQAYHQINRKHGEYHIYTLDLEENPPLAQDIGLGTHPSWSPDAQYVAASGIGDDPAKVRVSDGAVTTLGEFWFAWHPDWKRGPVTVCGDGTCEGAENECNCEADCGLPPLIKDPYIAGLCTDGLDNDCDGDTDCDDSDCSSDAICEPQPVDCAEFLGKKSCNAEASCRWNNRGKVCVSR